MNIISQKKQKKILRYLNHIAGELVEQIWTENLCSPFSYDNDQLSEWIGACFGAAVKKALGGSEYDYRIRIKDKEYILKVEEEAE